MFVQKQVESQLYRNGTDIAAVYNGLAESVAHFDEFCIIYCCMVNTVVISMSMIGIKTPRHENKFIKIVNGKALQLPWHPSQKDQLVRAPIAMLISRSAYFVARANS